MSLLEVFIQPSVLEEITRVGYELATLDIHATKIMFWLRKSTLCNDTRHALDAINLS